MYSVCNAHVFHVCFIYRHQAGIYVHRLVAHSPADECGCINIGDRILEVNGCDIRYSSLDQAAAILAVTVSIHIHVHVHVIPRTSLTMVDTNTMAWLDQLCLHVHVFYVHVQHVHVPLYNSL